MPFDKIVSDMERDARRAARRVLEACADPEDYDERQILALGRLYRSRVAKLRDVRLALRVVEVEAERRAA